MLQKHRDLGKRKSIVIVAEGAIDRELNDITPDMIKDVLSNDLGLSDTRVTTLGHTSEEAARANDRILATLQGIEAVDAVLEATPDTPSYVIGSARTRSPASRSCLPWNRPKRWPS